MRRLLAPRGLLTLGAFGRVGRGVLVTAKGPGSDTSASTDCRPGSFWPCFQGRLRHAASYFCACQRSLLDGQCHSTPGVQDDRLLFNPDMKEIR